MCITETAEQERRQKPDMELLKKQMEITEAVVNAVEKQRRHIGMELHDNVNQLLAAAMLYLREAKKPEVSGHSVLIAIAESLVESAMKEIRSLSHNLVSPFHEEYTLKQSLEQLADTISGGTGLHIITTIRINEAGMADNLKLTIYRIVQEQLGNIVNHARAKTVMITLVELGDTLKLKIKDDGVGFESSKKTNGIGFRNIKARASLLNGRSLVSSSPGTGCKLTVTFKL